MNVRMWMTREVITITPETPIAEAAVLMARQHIRRLPVVDGSHGPGNGRVIGIVSASDLLHAFSSEVNPFSAESGGDRAPAGLVRGIMTRPVVTIGPDEPVEVAASEMRERKIGGLPVVRDGRLVGLITESDIFRAFGSLFGAGESGARVTFDASRGEDVFRLVARLARRDGVRVASLVSAASGDRPVYVVRMVGDGVEAMLEDLWRSGHLVLSVIRFSGAGPVEVVPRGKGAQATACDDRCETGMGTDD